MYLKYIGRCQPGNGPKYGHIYNVISIHQEIGKLSHDDSHSHYVVSFISSGVEVNYGFTTVDDIHKCWEFVETNFSISAMKLVRDNIPDKIIRNGEFPDYTYINDKSMMLALLNNKLSEELNEYNESNSIEELVDIYEVICAILYHKNVPFEEFNKMVLNKRNTVGGFIEGVYLKHVISN